jgi:hypothetical protein
MTTHVEKLSIASLNIMTFSVTNDTQHNISLMAFHVDHNNVRITKLRITTLNKSALAIMPLSIITLCITTLYKSKTVSPFCDVNVMLSKVI